MFKKLFLFLLILLFSSNAFAFCFFGFGDCGGKNIFIIDKNTTNIDQNITTGSVGGFYFPGINLTLSDSNFFNIDLNGYLNQSTFDSNFNSAIASIMPINDSNLNLPSVWAAIDGNASSGAGGYYYAGASLTLDDDNYFHVNDENLNAVLDFSKYNCDNNSDCYITGDVNSTTGRFVNLVVTGTSTIEEDLSVIGDFNAGILGTRPLIYLQSGHFSLFGGTSSGGTSMSIMPLSESNGAYSTALGFGAIADSDYSIAMNNYAYAKGNYAMAFGRWASADGTDAVAIGYSADANLATGPGGCVAIGYEAECKDLGMVTLSRDVNVAQSLRVGTDLNVFNNIFVDNNVYADNFVGDINWSYVQNAPDFLTNYTDTNWNTESKDFKELSDLNNIYDARYKGINVHIPTEENIDANALAVINSLDLNTSLDYLPSSTHIPTEAEIDANALAVVNALDLNNSLTFEGQVGSYYLDSDNFTNVPYIPDEVAIDGNVNAIIDDNPDFASGLTEGGGFGSGGCTIIGGIIYCDSGVFSTDLNAVTIQTTDLNGNFNPSIDNMWKLGDASIPKRWKEINAIDGNYLGNLLVGNDLTVIGAISGATINTGSGARELDQDISSGSSPTFTGTNFTGIPSAGVTNNVSATAIITDHSIVRGHGGAKIVQGSGIIVDDSDNVSGMGTLGTENITIGGSAMPTLNLTSNVAVGPTAGTRIVNNTSSAGADVVYDETRQITPVANTNIEIARFDLSTASPATYSDLTVTITYKVHGAAWSAWATAHLHAAISSGGARNFDWHWSGSGNSVPTASFDVIKTEDNIYALIFHFPNTSSYYCYIQDTYHDPTSKLSWANFGGEPPAGASEPQLGTQYFGLNTRIAGDLRVDGGNIGITADADLIQMASNALTVNGTLGVGAITSTGDASITGLVSIEGSGSALKFVSGLTEAPTNDSSPYIYRSNTNTGDFPFSTWGHLVLQARSDASGSIVFMTGNPTPLVRGYINVAGATTLKSTLDAVDSITITSASAFGSPQLILTNTNRDPEADWHLQSRGDTGNFTIYDPSGSPRFYIDETGGEVNVAVDLVVGGTINSGAITTTDDIVINKNGGSLAIDVFKFSDWADQFVFEKNTAGNGFWHFQTLDARTTARSNNLFIWGLGASDAATNYERMNIGFTTTDTDRFKISTAAGGTGSVRPLELLTGANAEQLYLNTDGTINTSSDLTVGGAINSGAITSTGAISGTTITASSDLSVSGELQGSKQLLQFTREDAIDVTTTFTKFLDYGKQRTSGTKGFTAIRDGSITGVSINYDVTGEVGTGATAIQVLVNNASVWSNNLAGGGTIANDQEEYFTQARGTDSFSAGDTITVVLFGNGAGGSNITLDNIIVGLEIYSDA